MLSQAIQSVVPGCYRLELDKVKCRHCAGMLYAVHEMRITHTKTSSLALRLAVQQFEYA